MTVNLHIAVTFPEGTLWRSGVSLQNNTSITTHLHLYIGRDRASQTEDCSSQAKSSVDNLPLCHAIESKAGDYPRSFTKRKISHTRSSENPRSTRMTGTGPAFVSICNSKRVIPPPSVTDRDITQRPQLTSHSVTARTVFGLFVLQIKMLSTIPWHCLDL